jgi:aspartyl-tRNA(Asn)/glutamyl-tRNA(Gln) amidotransferase subunit B
MAGLSYKLIVGLEIHVQLSTSTKMFCGCALSFGEQANSRVCPVCLGMPGALPVMNKQAIEYAVLVATLLNCRIAGFTKWDRKSYYYPDLPKNYQISQYDLPLGSEGFLEILLETGQNKRIRIRRVHLEEDAGKNLHTVGNYSQVDLNRAGTPLLEIVTEPDMNSPAEVRAVAVELQRIVRYLGVSEADMQKGHMRFEPNVNLEINKKLSTTGDFLPEQAKGTLIFAGQTLRSAQGDSPEMESTQYKTPIVEVKNLNSFRALEKSVAFEINRQLDEFLQSGNTMQSGNKSTRGWDDIKEVTVLQREKEEAHDYRYFPDPDLVPVQITEQWLTDVKAGLCELPLKRQLRYVQEYKLSDYDAGVLTAERATADFFDAVVQSGGEPKRVCNLLTQVGLRLANEKGCTISELGLAVPDVAELAKMIEGGIVSATAGSTILEHIVTTGRKPDVLAKELNLIQKSDAGELEAIVEQIIAENPKAVEDVTAGGKKSQKALGFLLGQVMQKTKGQANPKIVSEILSKKLG